MSLPTFGTQAWVVTCFTVSDRCIAQLAWALIHEKARATLTTYLRSFEGATGLAVGHCRLADIALSVFVNQEPISAEGAKACRLTSQTFRDKIRTEGTLSLCWNEIITVAFYAESVVLTDLAVIQKTKTTLTRVAECNWTRGVWAIRGWIHSYIKR